MYPPEYALKVILRNSHSRGE